MIIKNEISSIILLVLAGLVCFASYYRFTYTHATKEIDHYEYIIQLDNEVNAKEFNEKYEVVERIGDGIYKVVERINDGQ